jgi:aspartyl-tRNA(Asn)/glutamyl-tRNA(Gln) amidotransferase subunit A
MGTTGADTLATTALRLARGEVSSTELLEECLARIDAPDGEGARTFIRRFTADARAAALAADRAPRGDGEGGPLRGIPVSVKDLFDVEGSVTTAGSRVLQGGPAARRDAPVVARLRAAGAIIVGTTNMTEFAMGAVGVNPHYGTPKNPHDRMHGRIPGGSSSGAVISVTDAMVHAAVGSDTAGSVQAPAALSGIVGFKPTARRVPLAGSIPLAPSLDSIGPLARSVDCCARMDAVLSGEAYVALPDLGRREIRLAIPQTVVLDDLEPAVARAFERAVSALSAAGVRISEIRFEEIAELATLNARGGFSVAEGWRWHRELLGRERAAYDPIVAGRFARGAEIADADYQALVDARARLIARTDPLTRAYDALLLPTVPLTAPLISEIAGNEDSWLATNRRLIRNPGVANFLDRCGISLPCHAPGEAPVGISLMGERLADRHLLSVARQVEGVLAEAARA